MTTLSLAKVRADFSRLVDSAVSTHERFDVTRNGQGAAVLMGADDYDSLIETLDVLSSSEAINGVRRGVEELGRGDVYSVDEVRKAMRDREDA